MCRGRHARRRDRGGGQHRPGDGRGGQVSDRLPAVGRSPFRIDARRKGDGRRGQVMPFSDEYAPGWTRTPTRSSPATRAPAPPCSRCCTWSRPRRVTSPTTASPTAPARLGLAEAEVAVGGQLLHHVQAAPGRRVPRRGLHEHPVRGHGRRPDPGRPARAPGRRRRRGHPGRQGQPGARGVQRRLRLRPGRHGQLGVLRQHDPRHRARPGRRPAVRRQDHPGPRPGPPVHLAGGLPDPGRLPRRPGGTGPAGRARHAWSAWR